MSDLFNPLIVFTLSEDEANLIIEAARMFAKSRVDKKLEDAVYTATEKMKRQVER